MKHFFSLFIYLLISLNIFCAGTIKNIRMNKIPAQLVFDITSSTKPAFSSSYDEHNRLLFLEIKDSKLGFKFSESKYLGKYIENFSTVDYGKNRGFFIKFKKNVSYKLSTRNNPHRIVLDLKTATRATKKQFTVAIDAGHGGKDSGAVGFGYKEKDIALAVAKRVQSLLGSDFNVVMTRSNDTYLTLSNRAKKANNAKADFFVSIHANASTASSAAGVEVFYFSKKSSPYAEKIAAFENSFDEKYGESTGEIAQIAGELAYNKNMETSHVVAKSLNTSLARRLNMRDRGVHGANFAVLRGFNGPGILVELGFISNSREAKKLVNQANQKVMAEEIATKVRNYFY